MITRAEGRCASFCPSHRLDRLHRQTFTALPRAVATSGFSLEARSSLTARAVHESNRKSKLFAAHTSPESLRSTRKTRKRLRILDYDYFCRGRATAISLPCAFRIRRGASASARNSLSGIFGATFVVGQKASVGLAALGPHCQTRFRWLLESPLALSRSIGHLPFILSLGTIPLSAFWTNRHPIPSSWVSRALALQLSTVICPTRSAQRRRPFDGSLSRDRTSLRATDCVSLSVPIHIPSSRFSWDENPYIVIGSLGYPGRDVATHDCACARARRRLC